MMRGDLQAFDDPSPLVIQAQRERASAIGIQAATLEDPVVGREQLYQFVLDSIRPGARLYATAHGCYETFLNGHRVGDMELSPGFTSYWANLHVQTYDVGDLLVSGENVWEVVLSDGWYRGCTGFRQQRDCLASIPGTRRNRPARS